MESLQGVKIMNVHQIKWYCIGFQSHQLFNGVLYNLHMYFLFISGYANKDSLVESDDKQLVLGMACPEGVMLFEA